MGEAVIELAGVALHDSDCSEGEPADEDAAAKALPAEILGQLDVPAPGFGGEVDGGEVGANPDREDAAGQRGGIDPAGDDVTAGQPGGHAAGGDTAGDRAEEERG